MLAEPIRRQIGLLLLANLPLFLSGGLCLGAYCSGDASGLQYLLLDWAIWAAMAGTVVLLGVWLWIGFPWVNLLLPFPCFLVASLPQLTGLGYHSEVIDRPGVLLAAAVLAAVIVVATLGIRGRLRTALQVSRA